MPSTAKPIEPLNATTDYSCNVSTGSSIRRISRYQSKVGLLRCVVAALFAGRLDVYAWAVGIRPTLRLLVTLRTCARRNCSGRGARWEFPDMASELGLQFDHVAVTVPDLDAAVEWYCTTFGFSVAWREDWTDAPARPLGLPGETVRLRGAGLDIGAGMYLELHEMPPTHAAQRRLDQTGISHFAFRTTDIDAAYARLAAAGVSFRSSPQYIADGGLAGERWVYAEDPWGVAWHLCQHPARAPFSAG
jgi:catechol 2,3-dioxygenase-like lactoylglutathione lyase family enzyme